MKVLSEICMNMRHEFIVSKMELKNLLPGRYVVAVSGGVDSVVLLHILTQKSDLDLIIAHIDHGIREDSAKDAVFVKELATKYKLPYESISLDLGNAASEDTARKARYKFLGKVKQKYNANAIITAHHQDDIIETALINLIRGTGYWGLSSLRSDSNIVRPMLNIPKKDILEFANNNNLSWQEDVTNQDKSYLRNKIRHDVVAAMEDDKRQKILNIIANAETVNKELERELNNLMRRGLHKGSAVLSRKWFASLSHDISKEVLRRFLLDYSEAEIDRNTIERAAVQIKTLSPGKVIQLPNAQIMLTKRSARLKNNSKTGKKQL